MLLCVDPRYDVNAARVVVRAFEAVASQHRDDSTASEDPDARIVAVQRLSEIHRSECTGRSNRPPTGAGGPARVSIRAEALASLYRLRSIYRDVLSDDSDSDSASVRPSHDAVALAVKVAVADAEVPSLVGEGVHVHLVSGCLRDSVSLAGCLSVY